MEKFQYRNPFVGLRAFEEEEDYLFFGRSKEIDDLLRKFGENRFLAVIGSSGSGKSSLVKSGMLPQIYGGFLRAEGNWRVALMQPGDDPIGNLARQLAGDAILYDNASQSEIPYESFIESRLRRSENGLEHVYRDARLPEGENLLIVVDQFEELFRFSRYEKEQGFGKSDAIHFIQILLTATRHPATPIYVLLTMRSDFLGDCSEFRGLPEAINEGQYLVPRMTREEIREAITGPVAVSHATISQRLVTRLLNDVNNDLDQLPILQHALMRTWDAWYDRGAHNTPIDFGDYEAVGTMESALSRHADEAYHELNSEYERHVCELMFKALTDTSAEVRGIRRPRSITDLCIITGGSQKEIKKQVEIFRKPGRTFLIPAHGIELSDDSIIDISHESLMRVWTRLVAWTIEEARSADLYRRLGTSAQLRLLGQRALLKDPELDIALKWKAVNTPTEKWSEGFKVDFGQTMAYLEESRLADIEEKNAQKQREASRRRMVFGIFGILGILVIAASIATLIFNRTKNAALAAESDALKARNKALLSDSLTRVALRNANHSDSMARLARDTALTAQERADLSAALARLKASEASSERDSAEMQRQRAEVLREQALVNTYKNAPSEYARLIREGPLNKKEIQDESFDYKLTAYAEHLARLAPKILATNDPVAIRNFNDLRDRLYYNNDLYEKIYACMETVPDPAAKKKLFEKDIPATQLSEDISATDRPEFHTISSQLKAAGKRINKIIGNRADRRIVCATDDNWLHVYTETGNPDSVVLESRIPMGTLVTALDYAAEKHIIYFGLKSGNIGYIEYGKSRKNQPVFENFLASPIVSVQLFHSDVAGNPLTFLLAAAEKSKVVIYKLDEQSLRPDKNLFGNTLPEKKLGLLLNARFDQASQRVVIRGQSQKSKMPVYYAWNPFTLSALNEYRKHRIDPAVIETTTIYNAN